MNRPRALAIAAASVCVALCLGLVDYETRSVWQLFNAENAPFMLLAAMAAFGVLAGLQVAIGVFFKRSAKSK